ncbi:MAG: aldehyde dehydrogenase family protein [Gammaproteobacteria bacterium]|nr:aldehyde dehydrogenase family protein [Gammaproteobacteria bacterium]
MGRAMHARNPRTGALDYAFTAADEADVAAACQALRQAQPAWAALGVEARFAVLERFADAIERHQDALAQAVSADTGRWLMALSETRNVRPALARWRRYAPEVLAETRAQSQAIPSIHYAQQLVPFPVVGVISPWNFPLLLSLIDALPALVAGCSVAIKPSEVTPRFAEPLARAISEVPELAGVLTLLPGDGRTGAALVEQVDLICFTGSVATGRKVGEACARAFIPAFLELGGKDPAIVLASADPHRAAETVLRASVLATGQACQSLERVYVHTSLYQPFVEHLVAQARQVELSYPDIHRGIVGPLIFERQAEIIAGQLADAVARGAEIRCGGEIEHHGGGLWIRPTVLTGVTHEMQIMTEETFGPIMPVMAFDSEEQAVRLANDSLYGLSAAVFAGSVEEGERIGRQLEVGGVSINDGSLTAQVFEAEKHSFRLSGLGGSRMGPAGLARFFRKKALFLQTGEPLPIGAFAEEQAVS